MQVELLSLSDTDTYLNLLVRYEQLRNSYKIRHRHYTLDTSRGNVEMARSRVEKMNAAAREIEELTPKIKEIVAQTDANLTLDPKNKRARLLRLAADVLVADVHDVAKLHQKINALRSQVFHTKNADTAKPDADTVTPAEPSLFD